MQLAAEAPLDVFGFHTGSLLAAELALARPDLVGRLVLSGIPMRSPEERAARLVAARNTSPLTEDGAAILETSAALWRYVVVARERAVPLERAAAVYAEKNRTMHRSWWAYEGVWSYDYGRLPGITQPTLVLQPQDALFEPSRQACLLIPGARFVPLPALDRDVLDVGVAEIAAGLREFLSARSGPRTEKRR
jgi:pimeloyl-ACP methyl ester carboxylesterase